MITLSYYQSKTVLESRS